MNKGKIDAAVSLILDSFRERPEMIRAVITSIWWDGFEMGQKAGWDQFKERALFGAPIGQDGGKEKLECANAG